MGWVGGGWIDYDLGRRSALAGQDLVAAARSGSGGLLWAVRVGEGEEELAATAREFLWLFWKTAKRRWGMTLNVKGLFERKLTNATGSPARTQQRLVFSRNLLHGILLCRVNDALRYEFLEVAL